MIDKKVRPILEMNAFDKQCPQSDSVARRIANSGASSVLFYRDPIEMVSAEGAWMTDIKGIRYLDFYNNVPCIGHSHPAVLEAVSKQIGTLNTNTRYIVPIVDEYLEALKSTFPEALNLTNIVLTCSGSEANDLAMRLACKHTQGTGFIVTESAYHGNTAFVTQVSPSALKNTKLPDHVIAIPPPAKKYYGEEVGQGFANQVKAAIDQLNQRGIKVAALLLDSVFSSDGVFTEPYGLLNKAIEVVHQAGGLYIADEVQPGFARTGTAFWGFQNHHVSPDIVTLGKPMGNGFPMAGVVTKSEYLDAFCADVGYFNTFGGNPVAAAAGLAVLKEIQVNNLQENARVLGDYLKQQLQAIAEVSPHISEVRGSGLFIGIDVCDSSSAQKPDAEFTVKMIDRLRDENILIGAAGPDGSTLKLRPTLCLTKEEADYFIQAFAKVLGL
ncbi:aminotransferase class III-fold pyridoxal phosphate-dependent enzyme [Marinomonas sp. A79]|uniref:Aminotransferase class III-fold pyridoxal phosphate-dependent enzyme n=1 Tax=Marinomonas vulgaris TaxID=2823372 RepID=A0ABS5HF58_9GAMM|nr:aminotransferase class III-fold pyridoxal phosphate-dependent enzyme [Marinomonas vulgaris]MBR7890277.1 aminotransferase class III-fold pyridoxal phosphate-dependent enzyme [Marinomonas vulgaris]